MASVLVALGRGDLDCMVSARALSLDSVRETRRMSKPRWESCTANSLPMPSEAPVTTAQLERGPKVRSCRRHCKHDIVDYSDEGRDSREEFEHTGVPGNMKRLNISLRKLMSFEPRKRKPIEAKNIGQGLVSA